MDDSLSFQLDVSDFLPAEESEKQSLLLCGKVLTFGRMDSAD